MHWTAHIFVGATLGYATGKPFLAELAGIGEHLTMDMIPHSDPETDFGHFVDATLGVATILLLSRPKIVNGMDPNRLLLFGAIGGALPDIELIAKAVNKDFDLERLIFPSHNGLIPHGCTGNKFFSYFLEAALMLGSAVMAVRRYKKLKQENNSLFPSLDGV